MPDLLRSPWTNTPGNALRTREEHNQPEHSGYQRDWDIRFASHRADVNSSRRHCSLIQTARNASIDRDSCGRHRTSHYSWCGGSVQVPYFEREFAAVGFTVRGYSNLLIQGEGVGCCGRRGRGIEEPAHVMQLDAP